jgi:hypothetical protein
VSLQDRQHKVTYDLVVGMTGEFSSHRYTDFQVRRKGPRFCVEGDDKYCSEQQKLADKFEKQWKESAKVRKLERELADKGKDLQGVRGTNGLMEESGAYKWTIRFGHEPGRAGEGDAVGICSELAENFGPLAFPVLGHKGGHSLGLYADGRLVFDHRTIAVMKGPPRRPKDGEAAEAGDGDKGFDGGDEDGCSEPEAKLPRCYQGHPWINQTMEGYYCQRCYSRGNGGLPFHCAFCRDGFCRSCYDSEYKKLNPEKKAEGEEDGGKKKAKSKKKKKGRRNRDDDSDEDDEDDEENEDEEEEEEDEDEEEEEDEDEDENE